MEDIIMNNPNSNFYLPNQPEYDKEFWNYALGMGTSEGYLDAGKKRTGGYVLPSVNDERFTKTLKKACSATLEPMCIHMRAAPRFSQNTLTHLLLGFRMAAQFRFMTECRILRSSLWKITSWQRY